MLYSLINIKSGEWLHKKVNSSKYLPILTTENITTTNKLEIRTWTNKKWAEYFLKEHIKYPLKEAKTYRKENSESLDLNEKERIKYTKRENRAKDLRKNYNFKVTAIA